MTTPTPSLKLLALIQLVLGAALAALAMLWNFQLGASMALGAGLMLFNLIGLGWSWHRLMAKKSIAWTILIIVIKYAVLLGSIFYLARQEWFNPLGAGLGISIFMVAALIMALVFHRQSGKLVENSKLL